MLSVASFDVSLAAINTGASSNFDQTRRGEDVCQVIW